MRASVGGWNDERADPVGPARSSRGEARQRSQQHLPQQGPLWHPQGQQQVALPQQQDESVAVVMESLGVRGMPTKYTARVPVLPSPACSQPAITWKWTFAASS